MGDQYRGCGWMPRRRAVVLESRIAGNTATMSSRSPEELLVNLPNQLMSRQMVSIDVCAFEKPCCHAQRTRDSLAFQISDSEIEMGIIPLGP
jgi:hypothetical protein